MVFDTEFSPGYRVLKMGNGDEERPAYITCKRDLTSGISEANRRLQFSKPRPSAGDIVWLDFTPQAGREQAGHRPALVLSPRAYNAKTNLMVCCPMTTQIKNYPFEVRIASTSSLIG